MTRILSSLFIALLVFMPLASAQDNASVFDALSLRGFGTLGVARSTNGQAEVARDLLQPRGISDNWSARSDSDFGLQANYPKNLSYPIPSASLVSKRTNCGGPIAAMVRLR